MMFALRTIHVIVITVFASLCALAQTPQPTATPESSRPPGTGMISGQVVDENNQPVPNAVVQFNSNRDSYAQTVIANRQGEFQIKDLAPLDYVLSARMPSYMAGRPEPVDGRYSYRIGDRVTLKLIKGGVVTGKVTDTNGNPVVGVGVRAQMVRDTAGRVYPRGPSQDKPTDDRGVYRIYGLYPGTYVVLAGGPDSGRTSSDQATFELDVPTFHPSSTRATAAEITVRSGEEMSDVDIRYRGEQGRSISGAVTVPSNLHTNYTVTLTSGGDSSAPWSTMLGQSVGRNFVFNGLDDGEYSLSAQSADSSGDVALSELKRVSVSGADVNGVQLTVKLLASVSGRVVLEETKLVECTDKNHPLVNEAVVSAVQNENEIAKQIPQAVQAYWSLGGPVRTDREGNFLLKNLVPNEYYFALRFNAPQWYVNSIAFAPPVPAPSPASRTSSTPTTSPASLAAKPKFVDATRGWTNVKGGERPSNLTITLVHGAASLRGAFVPPEGEQIPRRLVAYLVPAEPAKANDVLRFFADPVQSNGYIRIANIAPGRYWILTQPGEDGVTLPQSKIRLPNETETRARLRREAEAAKHEIELKPCQNADLKLPLKPATQN